MSLLPTILRQVHTPSTTIPRSALPVWRHPKSLRNCSTQPQARTVRARPASKVAPRADPVILPRQPPRSSAKLPRRSDADLVPYEEGPRTHVRGLFFVDPPTPGRRNLLGSWVPSQPGA